MQLFHAIATADVITCNYYEIDSLAAEDGTYRLMCGEDDIARVPDQEIEIDEFGYAKVKAVPLWDPDLGFDEDDGPSEVVMQFMVNVPLKG